MRRAEIFVFFVLFFVFCGAPQGPAPSGPGTTKPVGDIQYGTLTEGELQRFIKVLPTFIDIIEKEGKELQLKEGPADMASAFQAMAYLNKEIAYLDNRLRSAGMGWNEFWPAYVKTMFAYVGLMFDSLKLATQKEMTKTQAEIKQMEEMLKDPKIPEVQKNAIKASIEAYKMSTQTFSQLDTVYAKVPQVNKELVKKYLNALSSILDRD